MSKAAKQNKTQAVKDYLEKHPEAKPKDIAEELTMSGALGCEIKPNEVSAIKSKLTTGTKPKSPKVNEQEAYAYANKLAEYLTEELQIPEKEVEEVVKRVGKTMSKCGDASGIILRLNNKQTEVNWDE